MKARLPCLAVLLFALIQAACVPVLSMTPTPQGDPLAPTATAATPVVVTLVPQTTATFTPGVEKAQAPSVTLDLNGVVQSITVQQVAPVPPGGNTAWWEPMPGHTLVALSGYPIDSEFIQPRIFIYPVSELAAANENAGKMADTLLSLIQSPREIPGLPFLPLAADFRLMQAHLQYLDFKNGQGLRYLVAFGNGISPIHNAGLIYTYQGLTSDGKYYVAGVLPVHHPSLPADATVTGKEPPEYQSDYPAYREMVRRGMNAQAPNTFLPDLTRLDAMFASLEIQ